MNFNVHQVTSVWEEGSRNCLGGIDAVSWNQRTDAFPWISAGGDYDPSVAATTVITTDQEYTWSSPALTQLIRNWHEVTMPNYGLIGGSPDTGTTDRVFASRSHSTSSTWPRLVITYQEPD